MNSPIETTEQLPQRGRDANSPLTSEELLALAVSPPGFAPRIAPEASKLWTVAAAYEFAAAIQGEEMAER